MFLTVCRLYKYVSNVEKGKLSYNIFMARRRIAISGEKTTPQFVSVLNFVDVIYNAKITKAFHKLRAILKYEPKFEIYLFITITYVCLIKIKLNE